MIVIHKHPFTYDMLHNIAIRNQRVFMGIVKISDELHEDVRKNSSVMERSINSQAEFWMKIGRIAEQNPTLTFEQIIEREKKKQNITNMKLINE